MNNFTKQQLNVLVIPSGLFDPSGKGKSGLFEFQQAVAMAAMGINAVICAGAVIPWTPTYSKLDFKSLEMMEGVAVYRDYRHSLIPPRYLLKFGLTDLKAIYDSLWARYVSDHGLPNVIHAHNSLWAGSGARYLANRFDVPYVVTEHDSSHGRGYLNPFNRTKSALNLKDAQAVISVSASQASFVNETARQKLKRHIVIPNMVQSELWHYEHSEKLKKPGEFKGLVTIGELNQNKNHKLIIRAFRRIADDFPRLNLTIIGDGSEKKALVKMVNELKLKERITFTGELGRDELLKMMPQFDVYVHGSRFETFGVALIEALAFGIPAVSTNCGGPADIITQKNGLLCDIDDIDQMEDSLRQVLSGAVTFSNALIREDTRQRFGHEAVMSKLVDIYERVIHR